MNGQVKLYLRNYIQQKMSTCCLKLLSIQASWPNILKNKAELVAKTLTPCGKIHCILQLYDGQSKALTLQFLLTLDVLY